MTINNLTRRGLMGAFGVAAAAALAPSQILAQDKPKIKLGFIGPVSGGNAMQGLGAQNGFLLAIDQAKRRVTLETLCSVGNTVVVKGEALVLAPSRRID